MSEARAKLYINTGVVTARGDIYNILRPLLKQTVSYTYHRGAKVESPPNDATPAPEAAARPSAQAA